MQYLHRWIKGDEPHTKSTADLRGWLNFYLFICMWKPNDNELLDRIHDIENVLILRKQNLSLDNQTKRN